MMSIRQSVEELQGVGPCRFVTFTGSTDCPNMTVDSLVALARPVARLRTQKACRSLELVVILRAGRLD